MKSNLQSILSYILIAYAILSLMGSSCRMSHCYNPSLNLPVRAPSGAGDYRIFASTGYYPEAMPENVNQSHQLSAGGGVMVSLSKETSYNILMNAGYATFDFGTGFTFFIPTKNEHKPFIFNMRYQRAWAFWAGEGNGLAFQGGTYIYHDDKSSIFFMTGMGLAFASNQVRKSITSEENYQTIDGLGYGFVNNFGYGYEFTQKTSIHFETSIIYQYNDYNKIDRLIISPNLCIMVKF
ncbi:MAG: hypothetical protein NT007_10750 [Candidatus Kapabacteria bacterium]|nr:hypothetical protein [Candidatus Kapabacteria bacterium]